MENRNAGNMEKWSIFCPGPSLKDLDIVWALDPEKRGKVVAVNGAILKCHDWADYWAVVDPEVFTTVSKFSDMCHLAQNVKIWTYWGFEEMGRSHDGARWDDNVLSLAQKFEKEVWHRPENPDDIKAQYPESIVPFETPEVDVPWNEFTVFTAVSLAIKKGARSITLYGADMGGEGYFASGLINWRMNHKENRWMRERNYMSHIIFACERRGIKVDVFEISKQQEGEGDGGSSTKRRKKSHS